MKNQGVSPPKLFIRFFRWFCHPKIMDYIEGDLMEVYERRLKQEGKRKADTQFMIDVLLLFRPGIIRPREESGNLNYGMIRNYFKTGYRNLIRNKSYAVINVAGLAVSITCAILIFSLVKHNLGFDDFHSNGDRIYRIVTEKHRDVIDYDRNLPSPLGYHFRNDYTFAEKVGRIYMNGNPLIIIKRNDQTDKFREPKGFAFAEPEFFEIFNFPLVRGSKKNILVEPNTAIVTERIARKYFGEHDAVGEVFMIDNLTLTITGVLRDLPENTDIQTEIFVSYSTLPTYSSWMGDEIAGWGGIRDGMQCYTLLKPGITPAQVEAVLQPYVKKFRPNNTNVHHYKLQRLADIHFNGQYGSTMEEYKLWTMGIIGALLIVTACVNFVNLATAQALKRAKEVGVRKVLGGFKPQLFWQFIAETGLIVTLGIVLALVMAAAFAPFANDLLNVQIPLTFITDQYTLYFSLALIVIITLLAGYYPAVILSGFKPVSALKGKLSHQTIGGFNTRRVLIVAQFFISQVLIIGMIVIMDQMRFTQQANMGFRKDAIIMINTGSDSTGTKSSFVKNEISRLPGVEAVSLCFTAPASDGSWGNQIRFDNSSEDVIFRTSIKIADVDYMNTFGLSLVTGRNLSPSDTVREMLVNETLVHKLGLNSPEEILGRTISADGGDMKAPVVGVLKDFHDKSFHEDISPILLTTLRDEYTAYAVKINLDNAQPTLGAIEKIWLAQHPDQLFEYEFLDDQIAEFYEADKFILKSVQVFSLIAIFIGCLGLYGLISFMAAQKTKEIGIRKVLGGSVTHIASLFGREFAQLILTAALLAIPIGWWVTHSWLQEFKFQVDITPATFAMAIVFTLIISLCTVGYQVAKSAFANPVDSLRSE